MKNKLKPSAPKLLALQKVLNPNGLMVIAEGLKNIPFEIKRVFIIKAGNGDVRGLHAHRECSQLLICSDGEVEIRCTDGEWEKIFLLNEPSTALLIPSGIWAQQTYLQQSNTLTVLCDLPYDEDDYIRDFEQYLKEKVCD